MIFRTSCVWRSSKWGWDAGRALLYDGRCPALAIKGKLSELCALIGPASHTRLSRAHCYTCFLQLESERRGSWIVWRARPKRFSSKSLFFVCEVQYVFFRICVFCCDNANKALFSLSKSLCKVLVLVIVMDTSLILCCVYNLTQQQQQLCRSFTSYCIHNNGIILLCGYLPSTKYNRGIFHWNED